MHEASRWLRRTHGVEPKTTRADAATPGASARASVGPRVRGRGRGRKTAEAAVAAREFAQCRGERRLVEVGPIRVDEYELRVRAFPEQEVAQPTFAACSDQQVYGRMSLAVGGFG